MLSMYGNGKTWAEMTPQEQKITIIVIGIMVLGVVAYGIYYFFRNRKDK